MSWRVWFFLCLFGVASGLFSQFPMSGACFCDRPDLTLPNRALTIPHSFFFFLVAAQY